ncbi:Monocarboxylate transporter 7 [Armadillidium vulgare]|nr:Monocarboxylate transporter 7 [Armadillidium vulgare]
MSVPSTSQGSNLQEQKKKSLTSDMSVPSTSQGSNLQEQKKKNKKVILITDEDCDQLVHELHLKDNGYSWIILGALFAQCVIFSGFFTSFGIVVNALTDEFPDVTFTMLGVLMGLVAGFKSLLVPLVGSLEMYIGSRNVMIIGSFLFTFSLFVSTLCNKLAQIVIIMGVLLGIGQCLIESCQAIVLSQYFDSKLALAKAIYLIGSPFGGIIYPPILTTLFQNNGIRLSLLWLTGISLHLYICAFIIRPIQMQTQIRVLKTIEELFPKLTEEENDSISSQNKPLDTTEEDNININKAIKETVSNNIGGFKRYLKDKTKSIIYFIKRLSKTTEHENKATEYDGLVDQSNKYGATHNQGPSTFRSSVKSSRNSLTDFRVTIRQERSNMMVSGFGTILMPFGKSLTYLMSMAGFYTFGCASFHSYANVILSETFSKENEATTWGLFRLTQGIFSFHSSCLHWLHRGPDGKIRSFLYCDGDNNNLKWTEYFCRKVLACF